MTHESKWRSEWESLRAERSDARRRWRSAADGLGAAARDPLGLGSLVRDHPIAATGIGAVAGALIMKAILGHARASRDERAARPPIWAALLREAAVGVAVPWLVRMLREKFGWDPERESAPDPGRPAAQESAREPSPSRP